MSTDFVPETEDDEQPETAQKKKEGENAETDAETGTNKEAGEKKDEAGESDFLSLWKTFYPCWKAHRPFV